MRDLSTRDAGAPRSLVALVVAIAVACVVLVLVTGNSLLQQRISAGHDERITVVEPFQVKAAEGRKTNGMVVRRADGSTQRVISDWLYDETTPGEVLIARTTRTGEHEVIAVRTPTGDWQEIRGTSAASLFVLLLCLSGLAACVRWLLAVRRRGRRADLISGAPLAG